jgi:hypothetical protein
MFITTQISKPATFTPQSGQQDFTIAPAAILYPTRSINIVPQLLQKVLSDFEPGTLPR